MRQERHLALRRDRLDRREQRQSRRATAGPLPRTRRPAHSAAAGLARSNRSCPPLRINGTLYTISQAAGGAPARRGDGTYRHAIDSSTRSEKTVAERHHSLCRADRARCGPSSAAVVRPRLGDSWRSRGMNEMPMQRRCGCGFPTPAVPGSGDTRRCGRRLRQLARADRPIPGEPAPTSPSIRRGSAVRAARVGRRCARSLPARPSTYGEIAARHRRAARGRDVGEACAAKNKLADRRCPVTAVVKKGRRDLRLPLGGVARKPGPCSPVRAGLAPLAARRLTVPHGKLASDLTPSTAAWMKCWIRSGKRAGCSRYL